MRMGMRRFTRLANAFSKKVENLAHAVSLHCMHYNFARMHSLLTIINEDGRARSARRRWPLGLRITSGRCARSRRCSIQSDPLPTKCTLRPLVVEPREVGAATSRVCARNVDERAMTETMAGLIDGLEEAIRGHCMTAMREHYDGRPRTRDRAPEERFP
jgi:hypothetical protein